MKSKKNLYLVIFFFLAVSCSLPKDTDEKFEPSLKKRTEDAAKRDGGIILFGGDKKNIGVSDFSSTNVMWRATLKTLNLLQMR